MNDDFELSANSKLYKLLYFFSNFFLTSWIVPRFGESPTSRLFCLESVCTLIGTIVKLILFLILCSLIFVYSLQNLFVFNVQELESTNIFSFMGFIYKYVVIVLACLTIGIFLFVSAVNIASKISTRILSKIKLPRGTYFNLIKTYAKDKTNGICRRIVLTDLPPRRQDDDE